jgi:hypothetical protein
MRYLLLAIILCASEVFAQGAGVGPAPGIQLQDEGTGAGRVQILNCVGTGVTCTKSGVTGVVTITGGTTGTVTVGTDVVQNPWTASTVTTISHGLGAKPSFISWYIENLSADAGYVAGDRVYSFNDGASARGFSTYATSTTTAISTSAVATGFFIGNKTTGATTNITSANWKIVVKSFLIN